MFTGIIEEVGTLKGIQRGAASAVLTIEAHKVLEGTRVGDSIAVSGVCLTVTDLSPSGFTADAMPETLDRSTLGELSSGSPVNLERALLPTTRMGGHIVSGHIDGEGIITDIARDDNAILMSVSASPDLLRYIVEKGSVALDGISLTVVSVDAKGFSVSLIPHTFAHTDLRDKRVGDPLNIECDIIGKYVERLLTLQEEAPHPSGITVDFLVEHGF